VLNKVDALDAVALLRWAHGCVEALDQCREEINFLNVFPVADSDTGTNLLHTMTAAARKAEAHLDRAAQGDGIPAASARDVAVALARGAVGGARGNSGVILSQVLRGVAEAAGAGPIDGDVLQRALATALDLVTRSMVTVVEGTVVTVLRAAAEASAAAARRDLESVARAAADAAAEALAQTPDQLAVLGRAGVVDAGGRGLLVILDALVGVVAGEPPARPRFAVRVRPHDINVDGAGAGAAEAAAGVGAPGDQGREAATRPGFEELAHVHEYETGDAQYEVMYLLDDAGEEAAAALRLALAQLGDSVIVVGDGFGGWTVHVHSSNPGGAVEAGIAVGAVSQIRITAFAAEELVSFSAAPRRPLVRRVLALVAGADVAGLFESEGASTVPCRGELTPQELLEAIVNLAADEVLVLPNGMIKPEELVAVSTQARVLGRAVVLLPTLSMVQGLAALAVHDPSRVGADDAYTMAAAAAATRWGSVRMAQERALTWAGVCEPGNALGLVGDEVLVVGGDVSDTAIRLLDLMLTAGGELVTILFGDHQLVDADSLAEVLESHLRGHHPGVELMVYPGGQAIDLLQVGVE
jgi:DAK2 domain fusion protein YloV